MSTPRIRHTATLLQDGRVLVTGGNTAATASAEIYDPATGLWSLTTPMNSARSDHTATLLPNGKVLIVGGGWFGGGLNPSATNTAEIFDPITGNWIIANPMPTPRGNHAAALLPDGNVIFCGGGTRRVSSTNMPTLIYNPATDTWATSGYMWNERKRDTATLLGNGNIFAAGNSLGSPFPFSGGGFVFEVYTPRTGTWKTNGSPLMIANAAGRGTVGGGSSTLLRNGKVLVAGGDVATDVPANRSFLYDPINGLWVTNNTLLNAPRTFHTGTLLPDGRVLVAGGWDLTNYLSSAEIYDPTNGLWSSVSGMNVIRSRATATLLKDGRVLVVGGENNNGNVFTTTATAELFDPIARVQTPIVLQNFSRQTNGAFQFNFLGNPSGTNLVYATTNVTLPTTNWTSLGVIGEIQPGLYWFTDSQSTNYPYRFYQVRSQ
jgi:hypothetical protein